MSIKVKIAMKNEDAKKFLKGVATKKIAESVNDKFSERMLKRMGR